LEKANRSIHRGKVLHQAADAHPSSIKDIVEATGYKYGTFFKHIKTKDLSFSIIAKYGRAMQRDFSVEFPEMAEMPFVFTPVNNGNELSNDQLKISLQELQAKYSNLLEKHTAAIEELYLLREENRKLKERNG
jgi:hypothetical protein